MTRKEFHTAFNIQLDKSDSISHPSFLSVEKDYWINVAIRNIVKTRYSGNNVLRKGFQQNQKRTDDLRTVVKDLTFKINPSPENGKLYKLENVEGNMFTISVLNSTTNAFISSFPEDYWFTVGDNVDIIVPSTEGLINKTVDVTECTIDNITSKLNSRITEYNLRHNYAKPLRFFDEDTIYLYTDGNYTIDNYELLYISKPEVFSRTSLNENIEYTGMPEHIHDEIVAYAVRLALASITDERYQLFSTENQIIE